MRLLISTALALGATGVAMADPVNIRPDRPSVTVQTDAGPVEIARVQDNDNVVTGEWAKTSRACPPFCIQPMSPAEGVTTIGELELMDLLQDPDAVVVDSRVADWYNTGTIAGAINIPFTEAGDRLDELGCEVDFDGFECGADVPRVGLFCNGPWCGQSPNAIRAMIDKGYPADKLFYYRSGMQGWRVLGLSVTGGE